MAQRGYKLQEFVAHAANVNCLSFGKKNCRVFITGGDDHKVNLWSVGKPTALTSLAGHTSPIESAAFDSAEVLVVAGSSSGAIKLWDLEETKMVRTLTGHRSYCTAVEYHPFGEFFASGSMDTNLKIWDIRKKGCIHTYKGHTRGISTIRFTPDGRWVVSGGFDNVVKIWDLTAGKLLHDFKFHEGHIRSIEFHPLEFLLATGSADKTVKFWDLETFEMIGSTRREASGVRSVTFHPDGRTLFCGLDDSLKVYSWEPVICHDSVDMGWSTLGDLCIHDGKLLGGAYYQNYVSLWVADVSLMEPYGTRSAPEPHSHSEQKCDSQGSLLEKEDSHVMSKSNLRSTTPDSESKEIKTIYVDRAGVNSITSKTVDPVDVLSVVQTSGSKEINTIGIQKRGLQSSLSPSDPKENNTVGIQKRGPVSSLPPSDPNENSAVGIQKRAPVSSLPPSDPKENNNVGIQKHGPVSSLPPSDTKEINTAGIQKRGLVSSLPSSDPKANNTVGIQKHSPVSSLPSSDTKEISTVGVQKHSPVSSLPPSDAKEISTVGIQKRGSIPPSDPKESNTVGIQKHGPVSSLPPSATKEISTVGIQKRSPVSRLPQSDSKESSTTRTHKRGQVASLSSKSVNRSLIMPSIVPRESSDGKEFIGSRRESIALAKPISGVKPRPSHTRRLSGSHFDMERMSTSFESLTCNPLVSKKDQNLHNRLAADENAKESSEGKQANIRTVVEKSDTISLPATTSSTGNQSLSSSKGVNSVKVVNGVAVVSGRTRSLVERFEKKEKTEVDEICTPDRASVVAAEICTPDNASVVAAEPVETPQSRNSDQTTVVRDQSTLDDNDVIDNLTQNHDLLLSTFRSRLTKLQVVRHFWERNDIKGAINAVRTLPDHSVQADVVSALVDRTDVITLDLFCCLLPVLLGLQESRIERHASISLELLLKLVAAFGTVVSSAVSAPPPVGVNLHAEERIELCKQCFAYLQNVRRTLPELMKRGGVVARFAQQLNLVLQQT